MQFKIFDWTGNDKTPYYGTFETFEDAWGALYTEFRALDEDAFNSQMEEFHVEQIESEA